MLWEVGVEFVIPFYLEDSTGDDIVSGVVPYAIIRRVSDDKYYNSSTGLWQDSSYSILLNHYFEGIWCYTFLPDQQDIYVIKCNENTYSIRDGVVLKTVDRLSLLDNLDTTISSRLASADFNSKIDIVDANVDTINSNVSDIKSTVDTNLDATVSSRSVVTDGSIWAYGTRTLTPINASGVGVNTIIITCTIDGVVTEGINVFIYNSSRVAINQAISDSSGLVTFYLDDGSYYIDFEFNGAWSKEVSQIVSSNLNLTVDLESVTNDDNLLINFRELNSNLNLEVGATVPIGIEAYSSIGNNIFSISSSNCTVTGSTSTINCIIDGRKIYAKVPITQENWNYIEFSSVIGSETYKYEIKSWVD